MSHVIVVAAVLVWLNYKNAYEYWTEQRLALNKEVQAATQQVMFKLPLSGHQQTAATPAPNERGALFLQLTVDDLGMCLPMSQLTPVCCWTVFYNSRLFPGLDGEIFQL